MLSLCAFSSVNSVGFLIQLDESWDCALFLWGLTSQNWCVTTNSHWRLRYLAPFKIRQCICTLYTKRLFFLLLVLKFLRGGCRSVRMPAGFPLAEQQHRSELLFILGLAAPPGRCRLATGGHMYGQAGCPNSGVFSFSEADDWIETIRCFPHSMMKTDSLYEMSQRLLMRRSIQIIAVIAPWGRSSYHKASGGDSVCKYILGSELHLVS